MKQKIKDTELQLETYRKRYTTNKNKALGKELYNCSKVILPKKSLISNFKTISFPT